MSWLKSSSLAFCGLSPNDDRTMSMVSRGQHIMKLLALTLKQLLLQWRGKLSSKSLTARSWYPAT